MLPRVDARRGWYGLALLMLTAGVVVAQSPATRPAGSPFGAAREPEYAGSERVPDKLLNNGAGQSILMPTETGENDGKPSRLSGLVGEADGGPKPLPDGYMVGRRPGRVERREGNYELILDSVPRLPDAPPLRILPNARLTLLEAILADGSQDRQFLVTGRITEFKGSNYILLDNLAELVAPAVENPSGAAPTTQPAIQAENRPSGREPTAEELIQQLMKDKPARTLTFPDEAPATATATAPAVGAPGAERTHWPDETLLSDCQARLVPGEAGVWMLAFEDPGKKPTLRPIRILPSKLLETALTLTTGGTKPMVLVVSGEVTAHRGTNYILLRKVLVRRNMGNLR